MCLKSSGSPYLLYCTKVNLVNYCFLIDKKVKNGYTYPKIFIVHYRFDDDLYYGSLFETELLRTKKNQWILLIGDIYYYKDKKYMKMKDIVERINTIHTILSNEYEKDSFCDVCPIQIKKYFSMNTIDTVKTFVKQLPYKVKGYYFVPVNINYANILYMFDQDYQKSLYQSTNQELNFKITKGNKPEVYELFLQGGDGHKKIDFAYIPNIKTSHFLLNLFKEESNEDRIVSCSYNKRFQKWIPNKITDEKIHHLMIYKNIIYNNI